MDLNGCVSGNTIGQEQRGHFRHPWGGPQGCGGTSLIDRADHTDQDQWIYHAVTAVVRAHTFLRNRPQVDAAKIGMTGVSWGGVVNCAVAAVDDRFRFAFPIYGCGYLYDSFSAWTHRAFACFGGSGWDGAGQRQCRRWAAKSDPKFYLADAKIPVLWLTGTNDENFSLPAIRKSYDLVPGERHLALRVKLLHHHGATSEQAPEVVAAADHYLRGGAAFPTIAQAARVANGTVSAVYADAAGRAVTGGTLDYTCDNAAVWWSNTWHSVAATVDPATKTVSAALPEGVTYCYLSVDTADKVRASTPVLMPLDLVRAGKPYPHFIAANDFGVTNALSTLDTAGCLTRIASEGASPVPATRADFLAATAGTFFKDGAGRFDLDETVPDFAGSFQAVDGTLAVTVTNPVGRAVAAWGTVPSEDDGFFVYEHATLAMDASRYVGTAAIKLYPHNKAMVLAGEGAPDGLGRFTQGALYAKANGLAAASFIHWPFMTRIRLADDARLVDEVSEPGLCHTRFQLTNTKGTKPFVDLGGHTLSVAGAENLPRLSDFNISDCILSNGTISVSNVILHFTGNATTLAGTGCFRFDDARNVLKTEGNSYPTGAGWSFVFNRAVSVNTSANANAGNWGYEAFVTNTSALFLPLVLNGDWVLNNLGAHSYRYGYALNGAISGAGGVRAYGPQLGNEAFIHLTNPDNTFQGGAVVTGPNTVLGLYRDGALPANGGALVATNADVRLLAEEGSGHVDEAYHLPAVTAHVDAAKTNRLGQGVCTLGGDLVKTGAGTLELYTVAMGPKLDVRAGQVVCPKGRAGLYEGVFRYGITESGYGNSYWNGTTRLADESVKCGPVGADAYGNASTAWPMNWQRTYNGYIWNRSETSVNWTFASIFRPCLQLYIDGKRVLYAYNAAQQNYYCPTNATVTLTPGAHTFEVRLWACNDSVSGATAAAAANAATAGWTNWTEGHGLMLDRQGRGSTDMNDYEPLRDPGDGSLFTLTDDGACVPSFTTVSLGSGATLDLNGGALTADTLSGAGGRVLGDVSVTNAWRVAAADMTGAATTLLTVNGALTLAPGTRIVFDDAAALADKTGVTLVEADSISGDLTLTGAPGWEIEKTATGTIQLRNTSVVASPATNVWNKTVAPAGNTPQTAYAWSSPANWFLADGATPAPAAPDGVNWGARIDAGTAAKPRFIALTSPVLLTFLRVANYNFLLGDLEMHVADQGTRGEDGCDQAKNVFYCGDQTWHGKTAPGASRYDYVGVNGGMQHLGRLIFADDAEVATVAPQACPTRFRCDLWAESADPVREGPLVATNHFFSQGSLFWYGPRGADAQAATLTLTAGSVYALRSGTATLAPGSTVTGTGVAAGTFLRRIFGDTGWVELSQPATASGAQTLAFGAITPAMRQVMPTQGRGDTAVRFAAARYRAQDGCLVRFERYSEGNISSYWGLTASEAQSGLLPGDIEIGEYIAQKKSLAVLRNVRFHVDRVTSALPLRLAVEADCTARLAVTNAFAAAVSNVVGTLVKTGAGTLSATVQEMSMTGGLRVEGGALALAKDAGMAAGAPYLGVLELAAGTTFTPPAEGLRVGRLVAAPGATIAGGGTVEVAFGGAYGAPNLVQGATVAYASGSSEAVEAALGGVWMHLDASEALKASSSVETYDRNGTNFVSRWFDRRGTGEYAAKWTKGKTNIQKSSNGADDCWLRTGPRGMTYVDMGTNICATTARFTEPDRSLAFHDATGLIYQQTTWTYNNWNTTSHLAPAVKAAFFTVASDGGGGCLLNSAIADYQTSFGLPHMGTNGAPIVSFVSGTAPYGFTRQAIDERSSYFRVNGNTVYPLETPFSGGYDTIVYARPTETRIGGGLGFYGIGNAYGVNYSGGLAFGEVILCTNAVDEATLLHVEGYLRTKWYGTAGCGFDSAGTNVVVSTGSCYRQNGNVFVAYGLGGGGTIDGDLTMTGGDFAATADAYGVPETLVVTGTATLPAEGTVTLAGPVENLAEGDYVLLRANRIVCHDFAWQLKAPTRKVCRLAVENDAVVLSVYRNGLFILFK